VGTWTWKDNGGDKKKYVGDLKSNSLGAHREVGKGSTGHDKKSWRIFPRTSYSSPGKLANLPKQVVMGKRIKKKGKLSSSGGNNFNIRRRKTFENKLTVKGWKGEILLRGKSVIQGKGKWE